MRRVKGSCKLTEMYFEQVKHEVTEAFLNLWTIFWNPKLQKMSNLPKIWRKIDFNIFYTFNFFFQNLNPSRTSGRIKPKLNLHYPRPHPMRQILWRRCWHSFWNKRVQFNRFKGARATKSNKAATNPLFDITTSYQTNKKVKTALRCLLI